jgi:hypothetical protein
MKRTLAAVLILSGCAATQPPPVSAPVDPPAPSTIATLTPPEIAAAADQARRDAAGYVAWSFSRPENIDRLTTLTTGLDAAIARMKAGRVRGRYRPADVVAARAALRELRAFLVNKGD